eukprot:CAMPEP_0183713514 /NCGR_PEP_ID=MMETSP0737-20130205/8335_1 /TAXON_ID=385413 /ORGANISM="Thalassiosira miniscula, Strain CCMP1093" /LENGTH=162 /DNA_ID=CAMNT_0025942305 /DNA_START=395 /DNA_END=884 /DNA_ORIENTATION=+
MDLYANSKLWCWITPENNAARIGAFYGPLWAALAVATLSMVAICGGVILQEKKAKKYRMQEQQMAQETTVSSGAQQSSSASREVVSQAVFYVLSFYLTFIFPSWTRVSQMVHGSTPFFSIALFSIFFPMQGLFNCMVYFRPRVINYSKIHPELNILQANTGA